MRIKVEPKPNAKPVETTPASQNNSILNFKTLNRSPYALEGWLAKAFKVTQTSADEAILTMTDDAGITNELLGLLSVFTENGVYIMNFIPLTGIASRLYMTKPGKLKLIDGERTFIEHMQTTGV